MARTLAKNLERAGHAVEHAPHGEAALARLGEASFDVVLTDLKMPVMDGMALLRAMHERRLPPAVVVLTGYGTIESAVEAMKLGAADYLIKDARPQEILLTIERVLRLDALKRENVRLRGEIGRLHGFGELIGEGAPMKGIYRVINTVAGNKSTVLVSGESGTGKELVARTIHERGALAAHPFVAINCAGLSETLLDSQLFGRQYQVAPKRLAAEAMERLRAYGWPGNVRELQNAIERAFALAVADTITLDDLPAAVRGLPSPDAPAVDLSDVPTLEEVERRLFAAALRKSGGNKNEAARLLGIDRQRLYRKIEKYGLG